MPSPTPKFITFSYYDPRSGRAISGWSERFFQGLGLENRELPAKIGDWYCHNDYLEIASKIRQEEKNKRLISWGVSMGAVGAIRTSKQLQPDIAILFSTQFDPRTDKQFRKGSFENFAPLTTDDINPTTKYLLVGDFQLVKERRSLKKVERLLRQVASVESVHVQGTQHNTYPKLAAAKLIVPGFIDPLLRSPDLRVLQRSATEIIAGSNLF